jgi:hypothetical protein
MRRKGRSLSAFIGSRQDPNCQFVPPLIASKPTILSRERDWRSSAYLAGYRTSLLKNQPAWSPTIKKLIVLVTVAALAFFSVAAQATIAFNPGLAANTSGWFEAFQPKGNYRAGTWVSNGTINRASGIGSLYDVVNNGNDPNWDLDQGFNFSVTSPETSMAQPRGHIIHSALTSTGLLIGSVVGLDRDDSNYPGGNHYGWFTLVDVPPGLTIDKTPKNVVPGSLLLLGSGLVGLALYRWRRIGSGN